MNLTIKNNQDRDEFIEKVRAIDVTSNYRAEFVKIRRKRSLNQNNLLWLYLTIGEQESGNERNDLYAYFLDRFPTTKQIEINDELCLVPITSSQFNTSQMTQFIENIRRVFAEMGIHTPDPDSDKVIEIYNYYRENGII